MWIKICGIRDLPTALAIAKLGADAVGLNFFAKSTRHVTLPVAREIVAGLPDSIEPVGLFVNHTLDQVVDTCRKCPLRTVQIHGDESPEFLAELSDRLPNVRLIRAYRIAAGRLDALGGELDETRQQGVSLYSCLVDAFAEGAYGGTGRVVDWSDLAGQYKTSEWPPLILAGGLNTENVAQAVRTVRPWGIDTASGVESAPGIKDLELVGRFIENARGATDV